LRFHNLHQRDEVGDRLVGAEKICELERGVDLDESDDMVIDISSEVWNLRLDEVGG
jgi:hypothetical protein